jgi:hypothetical protein
MDMRGQKQSCGGWIDTVRKIVHANGWLKVRPHKQSHVTLAGDRMDRFQNINKSKAEPMVDL